jgi:hypothetical protein
VWGGPTGGGYVAPIAASKLAFAPRGKLAVADVIGRDLWEIGLPRTRTRATPPARPSGNKAMGFGAGALAALILILALRRR